MNENIIDSIKKIQEGYYSVSKKTFFNKKELKNNCAELIAQNFSLEELVSKTVYTIPDTNRVFVDYTIFKTFATPSCYQAVVDSLISRIISVIDKWGTFEVHLNLNSLTATGLDRYNSIFQVYYNTCCSKGLFYDKNKIDKIIILNTPMVISTLIPIIVRYTDPSIKSKIICIKK
jgi:phosphopantetheinyl transferase (holo-ACP synthase)